MLRDIGGEIELQRHAIGVRGLASSRVVKIFDSEFDRRMRYDKTPPMCKRKSPKRGDDIRVSLAIGLDSRPNAVCPYRRGTRRL